MAGSQATRTVICSKHGIAYDASKRGGCSRCIQEWERQKSPPAQGTSGFPTPVKLLGLLLVVAGFYVLLTRPSEQDAPATTPSPVNAAAPAADSATAQALRRLVDALPALIAAGRTEAEVHMADSSNPDQQREDWQFWSRDWTDRVTSLKSTLPAPPDSRSDLKLTVVFQDVSKVFDELQSLTADVQEGIPDTVKVRKRFESAERALERARSQLSQLSSG